MEPSTQVIVEQTKKWIEQVVIQHNFCPFAAKEFLNNSINYRVVDSEKLEECVESIYEESILLKSTTEIEEGYIETSLVICPKLKDFLHYLDGLDLANRFLKKQGLSEDFQLASFHPDYCFADATEEAPSNFTNRSPYPMYHLLRQSSMNKAVESHPDTMSIPENNIAFTEEKGIEWMKQLLESCYH